MPSVRLWAPESDYDSQAIQVIAQKIVDYYKLDLELEQSTKTAYIDATSREPNFKSKGLEKAVNTYLIKNDFVIFLIDADGHQSLTQRCKQLNSYQNTINEVIQRKLDRVKLILIRQEIEAWLLVDCLGICCHFTKNSSTRDNLDWKKFARNTQNGATDLITEAIPGGNNAKEHLIHVSKKILTKGNSNLKPRDLRKLEYSEDQASKIAKQLEINETTIRRNSSLVEFAELLKKASQTSYIT